MKIVRKFETIWKKLEFLCVVSQKLLNLLNLKSKWNNKSWLIIQENNLTRGVNCQKLIIK